MIHLIVTVWLWIEGRFQYFTGANDQSGSWYGSFSGWVPCLAIVSACYGGVKHLNCHAPRCLRIGRYPTEGGEFKLCHFHHPDHDGKKPTLDVIHARHQARKHA